MLSAIWRICFFECVRALRGLGLSEAIGRGSAASRARGIASEALLDALIPRLPILTMTQLSFLGTPSADQGSTFKPPGKLVGTVDKLEHQDRRRDEREVGNDIDQLGP
jgi:hypothetical protein